MRQQIKRIFFFLLSINIHAQNGYWKAPLPVVKQNGYYKIMLHPAFVGNSNASLHAIRLIDKDSVQVPFQVNTENDAENYTKIETVDFTFNSTPKQTDVFIKNKKENNSLILKFKNFDFDKSMTLFGSDNRKDWFGIKQNIILFSKSKPTEAEVYYELRFPASSYQFLKFSLNDSISPKINLLSVGKLSQQAKQQILDKIENPNILVKDSTKQKQTFYKFEYRQSYQFVDFNFNFDEQKPFRRTFTLYKIVDRTKNADENLEYIAECVLTKENQNVHTGLVIGKSFVLVSENFDNPTLKLKSIDGFQEKKSILTYLESDKPYFLISNSKYQDKPNFDLTLFKDTAANNAIGLEMEMEKFISYSILENTQSLPSTPKWILWIVIITAVGLLTFMSIKLMGEVKKKDSN